MNLEECRSYSLKPFDPGNEISRGRISFSLQSRPFARAAERRSGRPRFIEPRSVSRGDCSNFRIIARCWQRSQDCKDENIRLPEGLSRHKIEIRLMCSSIKRHTPQRDTESRLIVQFPVRLFIFPHFSSFSSKGEKCATIVQLF